MGRREHEHEARGVVSRQLRVSFKELAQNGARRETVSGSSGGARRTLCAFKMKPAHLSVPRTVSTILPPCKSRPASPRRSIFGRPFRSAARETGAREMSPGRKPPAEFAGTFRLIFGGYAAHPRRYGCSGAPWGLAPIAIGFGLTSIHRAGIPVTNTSVNPGPRRRTGALRRRLGHRPMVAFPDRSDPGRGDRRPGLPAADEAARGRTAPAGRDSEPFRATPEAGAVRTFYEATFLPVMLR